MSRPHSGKSHEPVIAKASIVTSDPHRRPAAVRQEHKERTPRLRELGIADPLALKRADPRFVRQRFGVDTTRWDELLRV